MKVQWQVTNSLKAAPRRRFEILEEAQMGRLRVGD
jgi:hypothetical protein